MTAGIKIISEASKANYVVLNTQPVIKPSELQHKNNITVINM